MRLVLWIAFFLISNLVGVEVFKAAMTLPFEEALLPGILTLPRQSQIDVSGNFNYTPYVCTAILFLAITVPMTRFTDWLIARDRSRQFAGMR